MEVNGAPELLFPTFFRISSFVFSRTKTCIQVWNYLRVSKLWLNFQFWVNYPFNIIYEAKACISDTHQGRQRGRDGMIQIKKQLQGCGIQKGCRWEKSHKVMLEFNMNTPLLLKRTFWKKSAHQGCIIWSKIVKPEIVKYENFIVFYFNWAEFSVSLLQSSVSHDFSEILLICWFAA